MSSTYALSYVYIQVIHGTYSIIQSFHTILYNIVSYTILSYTTHTFYIYILHITKYNDRNTHIPFPTLYAYIYIMIYKQSNTRYIDFLPTVDSTPDTHTDTHIDIAGHHHRRLYHLSPTLPSSAFTSDPSCRDILGTLAQKQNKQIKEHKILSLINNNQLITNIIIQTTCCSL